MAKMTCKVIQSSGKLKAASGGTKATGTDFALNVGFGDAVTISGVDSAGNAVPLTGYALTVTSADATQVSVDTPVGMTYNEKALAAVPASSPCVITIVATPDGSVPNLPTLTITDPIDVTGPASALVIHHGTPTIVAS